MAIARCDFSRKRPGFLAGHLLMGAALLVVSGCGGVQYADKVRALDITRTDHREATTNVLAIASEWRNSGVELKRGVKYRISAVGTWSAGGLCGVTGPDGLGVPALCYGGSATYMGTGSGSLLIGKIGEGGMPFAVGNGIELTAASNGILFFRINDAPMWTGDNSGSVTVTTALIAPPPVQVARIVPEVRSQPARELPSQPERVQEPVIAEKLPPPRRDTFAVVIGVDYTSREEIPNLHYASQDAKKVYDVLTDPRYGGVPKGNAILLLNEKATRSGMIAALRKIKTWDGFVYVYYSGHGAPKTKEEKMVDAFLVPIDAVVTDPDALEETSVKVSYLQELIATSKAKGVLVMLDACFTGGGKSIVAQGGKPLVGMLASSNLIAPEGAGRVVITSSSATQQSWEDESELKSGIFSYYLLEGLKGKGGSDTWVKVHELADYLKENVANAARKLKGVEQNPQIMGKGDFAVARNWERARVMDVEVARSRLKDAFERGSITTDQLNKALNELRSPKRSKTLEAFLEGKIDERKFGELY